ncbi:MAG: hypothetical protein WCQ45_05615, partial [bacterium]
MSRASLRRSFETTRGKPLVNEKSDRYTPRQMGDLLDLGKRIADLNGEMARGLAGASDAQALERFRVEYLGRKGRIAQLFKALAEAAPDDKGEAGRLLNESKDRATSAFEERAARLTSSELQERLLRESVDVTLPGV